MEGISSGVTRCFNGDSKPYWTFKPSQSDLLLWFLSLYGAIMNDMSQYLFLDTWSAGTEEKKKN